jgi:hypothetical protein
VVNGESKKMKTHKQLDTWQQAMQLVKMIYEATASFPREELFGLTSQMRRAAVSIPSNIADKSAGASFERCVLASASKRFGTWM